MLAILVAAMALDTIKKAVAVATDGYERMQNVLIAELIVCQVMDLCCWLLAHHTQTAIDTQSF